MPNELLIQTARHQELKDLNSLPQACRFLFELLSLVIEKRAAAQTLIIRYCHREWDLKALDTFVICYPIIKLRSHFFRGFKPGELHLDLYH